MSPKPTLEEAVAMALSLDIRERLQLVERVVAAVEDDLAPTVEPMASDVHWGKALNDLMEELGPVELKYPEIEDPVEWVKHSRAEQRKRRFGNLEAGE